MALYPIVCTLIGGLFISLVLSSGFLVVKVFYFMIKDEFIDSIDFVFFVLEC